MTKPKVKYYPDSSFKMGDKVCEYIPYPGQVDTPWSDDGPKRRYVNRVGTFLGNVDEIGYSSWVKVGTEIVKICRRDLCFN